MVNGGVNVNYVYSNFNFGNNGDEILVIDDNLAEITRIEFPSNFDVAGYSKAYDIDCGFGGQNIVSNWAVETVPYGDGDYGTPGELNTVSIGGCVPELNNPYIFFLTVLSTILVLILNYKR